MRNRISFVIAIVLIFLACGSAEKPASVKTDTAAAVQQTTYWVVIMNTLIGTEYISEVCPLPVDDKESVAAAANGWGSSKGRMASESSVHKFASREDAEKFRKEKRLLDLELNAGELIKYLCIGQTLPPPKDYWVIIMQKSDWSLYISEVCPLPAYDKQSIVVAASRWSTGKAGLTVEGAFSFTSQEEAEKFRREKALPALNLNANTLQKYLCAIQPYPSNAGKTSP